MPNVVGNFDGNVLTQKYTKKGKRPDFQSLENTGGERGHKMAIGKSILRWAHNVYTAFNPNFYTHHFLQ